jgi:hypothetical protein
MAKNELIWGKKEVPDPHSDVVSRLRPTKLPDPEPYSREKAEAYFETEPIESTKNFGENRAKVETSLQKLVRILWQEFNLPTENITEYGPGYTQYFDRVLRPKHVERFRQVELNKNLVRVMEERERKERERLGKRYKPAEIVFGSYNNIPYRNLSMIVGLSSFDTAGDLPHAIDQVMQALRKGGIFFHVQDVRPGADVIAGYLKRMHGEQPTHGFGMAGIQNPIMGYLVAGRRETADELFRRAMQNTIDNHPQADFLAGSDGRKISSKYVTLVEQSNPKEIAANLRDKHPEHARLIASGALPLSNVCEVYFINTYSLMESSPSTFGGKRLTTVIVSGFRKK